MECEIFFGTGLPRHLQILSHQTNPFPLELPGQHLVRPCRREPMNNPIYCDPSEDSRFAYQQSISEMSLEGASEGEYPLPEDVRAVCLQKPQVGEDGWYFARSARLQQPNEVRKERRAKSTHPPAHEETGRCDL